MKELNLADMLLNMFPNDLIAKRDKAMAEGHPMMIFDWKKAAELINKHVAEGKRFDAVAGLKDDFRWTGGTIYICDENGGRVNTGFYTYLSSVHAPPLLVIEDPNGEEIASYECWECEKFSKYNCDTKWPEDALEILNGKV